MKSLTKTLAVVLLLVSAKMYAQTDKYQAGMQKGLGLLSSSKTSSDFIAAANHFERIANVETKQWLPVYYASYANLVSGLLNNDNNLKDQYWDKALQQAAQAETLSAQNSEIYTLKGYIQFMKMTIDPPSRMSFMQQSSVSLDKAKALNPDNPRPYFVQGQGTFYTPEAFGGGKTAAKPILETAVAKYAQFKPENPLAPDWGGDRAKMLLDQCK
jgi:hypothetical protein